MFYTQGGVYFRTDLKWLTYKIWMLKSNFKLVGRKFVRCFIDVQNLKKFDKVLLESLANLSFTNKNIFF